MAADLVAFGARRPRPVGSAVQGGYAHVSGDRVRGVLAQVAVGPVAAPIPRELAHAPKRPRLAATAQDGYPVDLGPMVSP